MDLALAAHDGYTLVRTLGSLDESARDAFRQQLHPVVGQSGGRLIIDLTGSPRINSAGLGNLVALVADANTNGSRVVLCNLPAFVSMVIGVTKLDRYFEIVGTLEEAEQRLAQPPQSLIE
jgi:anti-sigma B factor antagonist